MSQVRTVGKIAALIGVMSFTGCYSMHPQGMHPGMYGPGPAPARRVPLPPPRQTIIMPSSPQPAVPIITQPSTFSPGTAPQAPAPRMAPGNSSAEKAVPLPRDPGAEAAPEPAPQDRTSNSGSEMGFLAPNKPRYEFSLKDHARSLPAFAERRIGDPVPLALAEPDPLPMDEPEMASSEISQVGFASATAHDPEFRMIQGVLHYDARRKSWHLMYDDNPGRDPSGGDYQLSGHLPFTPADHGRFFRVEGRLHNKLLDRLNKPQFVVKSVKRLDGPAFEN